MRPSTGSEVFNRKWGILEAVCFVCHVTFLTYSSHRIHAIFGIHGAKTLLNYFVRCWNGETINLWHGTVNSPPVAWYGSVFTGYTVAYNVYNDVYMTRRHTLWYSATSWPQNKRLVPSRQLSQKNLLPLSCQLSHHFGNTLVPVLTYAIDHKRWCWRLLPQISDWHLLTEKLAPLMAFYQFIWKVCCTYS